MARYFAIALITLFGISSSGLAQSIDLQKYEWSKADIARETALFSVMAIDWGQTRYFLRDGYEETAPGLSKHPTDTELAMAFIGIGIGHVLVAHYLPPKYRKWWQYIFIAVEAEATYHNYRGMGGLKLTFG